MPNRAIERNIGSPKRSRWPKTIGGRTMVTGTRSATAAAARSPASLLRP